MDGLEVDDSAHEYKPDSAAWFLGIVIYVITSGVLTQATGRWNAFMLPMLLFCIVCAAKGHLERSFVEGPGCCPLGSRFLRKLALLHCLFKIIYVYA